MGKIQHNTGDSTIEKMETIKIIDKTWLSSVVIVLNLSNNYLGYGEPRFSLSILAKCIENNRWNIDDRVKISPLFMKRLPFMIMNNCYEHLLQGQGTTLSLQQLGDWVSLDNKTLNQGLMTLKRSPRTYPRV